MLYKIKIENAKDIQNYLSISILHIRNAEFISN